MKMLVTKGIQSITKIHLTKCFKQKKQLATVIASHDVDDKEKGGLFKYLQLSHLLSHYTHYTHFDHSNLFYMSLPEKCYFDLDSF